MEAVRQNACSILRKEEAPRVLMVQPRPLYRTAVRQPSTSTGMDSQTLSTKHKAITHISIESVPASTGLVGPGLSLCNGSEQACGVAEGAVTPRVGMPDDDRPASGRRMD